MTAAGAQEYPARPIRLLIPFPPGGGTDLVSRVVGNKLAETLKWTIVLENRPGASGNIALELAAKSPPDGYTIVMGQSDNIMLGPWLYQNVGYDTLKSFAPIVQVSVTPLAVVSAAQSRLAKPGDLIAQGRTPKGCAGPPPATDRSATSSASSSSAPPRCGCCTCPISPRRRRLPTSWAGRSTWRSCRSRRCSTW